MFLVRAILVKFAPLRAIFNSDSYLRLFLLISLQQLLVKFVRKSVVVYVRVMLPHGRHEHLFISFLYISLCVVLTTIAYLVYVSPIELLSCGLLSNRSNLWVACVSPVSKICE